MGETQAGSAPGCFDVHLTPRPDDFRAEEHRDLSVTMEHLGQMSIIHVDNACWVLLRLGRGIQPDGHEPKSVGCFKSNARADLEKRGRRRHFARGHHTIGEEIVDLVLDRTKKWTDDRAGLQGFLLCSKCGGITRLWSRVYASGTFVRRAQELIETQLHGVDSSATRDGRPGAVQRCRVRAFLA